MNMCLIILIKILRDENMKKITELRENQHKSQHKKKKGEIMTK